MRILYAIQGTGNGHLSRAQELLPFFQAQAEVDVLLSGNQSQLKVPFDIKYQFDGISFVTSKNGDISLAKTFSSSSPIKFIKDVLSFPIEQYDLVISDFEPVSAWSARYKGLPCVELSHQCAVRMPNSPRPESHYPFGKWILDHYCPSSKQYGFHFEKYNSNVFYPIIRKEILNLDPVSGAYYLVYLPGYSDDQIFDVLSQFNVEWRVFSKTTKEPFTRGYIQFSPILNDVFIQNLKDCEGVLCGAGFELPAEAIYLKKKLMVIPLKNHYEQQCNAAALKQMGVPIISELKILHYRSIALWLNSKTVVGNLYTTEAELLVERILDENGIQERGRIVVANH